MRAIINISLPEQLSAIVNQAVKSGNYSSKSEFFRSLLKNWMEDKLLYDLKKSQTEIKLGKGKLLKSLKDLE